MSMLLLDEEEVERPRDTPDTYAKNDWKVALKRAVGKFGADGCTDLAAALTYRSMQSLFPGLIAVLSLLNIFGNGKETAGDVVDKLAAIVGKDPGDKSLDTIKTFIENITTQGGGAIAFVVGILLALNSASGYVAAFSKATNRMYDIREGRSTISLKLSLIAVTAVEVVLMLVVIFAIVTTGSVAKELGDSVGLGQTAVTVWDWAKWPFVIFIVVLIIGMLYWAAPNVQKTKKDIFTWGALIGFVVWLLASIALGVYITLSHGASYQKTYGLFANAIIFLLWLWITNLAVLFGAEVDAELLRTRQLKSGLPAEEMILLPPKSDAKFAKLDLKAAQEYDAAHELRLSAMREAAGDPHVYGRAGLAAGQAAQIVGESSMSQRSGKTGLVGPRDATAPRAETMSDDEVGMVAVGPEEMAAIEEARLRRRDSFLVQSQKARLVRDRLDRQRAKAEKKAKERRAKAEKELKIKESYVTREQRWESVAKVRAEFDPPQTPDREHVRAERDARRAAYDVEQAEKQAERAQQPPKPKKPEKSKEPAHEEPEPPSVLRSEIEQEQQSRRDEWFAAHPKRTAR
ncbi:YhjD/YihY/BrkB family envelope integrity protein [Flexivirga sp. B27]